jgi:hypothetical protein
MSTCQQDGKAKAKTGTKNAGFKFFYNTFFVSHVDNFESYQKRK